MPDDLHDNERNSNAADASPIPLSGCNWRARRIPKQFVTLDTLKRKGELDFEDIGLLSRMIDAMICKIAIMMPEAENPEQLRERGQKIVSSLLEVFRRG